MSFSKKPAGRLPAHLTHLKTGKAAAQPGGASRTAQANPRPAPGRGAAKHADEEGAPRAAAPAAPDRLGALIPVILQAMFAAQAVSSLPAGAARLTVMREDVLAALAPYYRPNSRFERLIMARLVGEGYLTPRGGRDKQGVSGHYDLSAKGEKLLGIRRARPSR